MQQTSRVKTFFLDQHGCAKNQVDGEYMISRLEAAGFSQVCGAEAADCIIINTCGFIESAKKESLEALFNARKTYPGKRIIFAGCLAERYRAEFRETLTEADVILGFADDPAGALAGESEGGAPSSVGISIPPRSTLLSLPGSAYVKIAEGCSNYCSFCAIPLIRGPLRSRNIPEILREIRLLLERGIFEINLIAQDVGTFGSDGPESSSLSDLLSAISGLSGDFWVRLLYIHPDHFPLPVLDIIASDRRFLPYFDIPFQSGSDSVLAAMNRRNNASANEALALSIRERLGAAVFRSTWLCGFPGESAADALATEVFLSALRPLWSGAFPYSREEGTPAAGFPSPVGAKTARRRAAALEALQSGITSEILKPFVGTVQRVLIEENLPSGSDPDQDGVNYAIGRAWFQAPEVDGAVILPCEDTPPPPGKTVQVIIKSVSGVDLVGHLVV